MYSIQREALSPGRPIRYQFSDDSGAVLYTIERTEERFELSQQRMQFLNPAGEPIAQLVPPDERSLWRATRTYQIMLPDKEKAQYTIEQIYSLVDRLLLRLPHYKLRGSGARFGAHGSRHGEHFYEIFDGKDHYLAQIERPVHGYTYAIEGEPSPVMHMPLLLAALLVVIDLQWVDATL